MIDDFANTEGMFGEHPCGLPLTVVRDNPSEFDRRTLRTLTSHNVPGIHQRHDLGKTGVRGHGDCRNRHDLSLPCARVCTHVVLQVAAGAGEPSTRCGYPLFRAELDPPQKGRTD